MQNTTSEIKKVIWIDKNVFNDENEDYKNKMEIYMAQKLIDMMTPKMELKQ